MSVNKRTNELYGYESKDIKVGKSVRKVQVFPTGRAQWVGSFNGKLVYISGKVKNDKFFANKAEHKELLKNYPPAQRDRINVVNTKSELNEKLKNRRDNIIKFCRRKFGKTININDEVRSVQYLNKTGYGFVSYKGNKVYGNFNEGKDFVVE